MFPSKIPPIFAENLENIINHIVTVINPPFWDIPLGTSTERQPRQEQGPLRGRAGGASGRGRGLRTALRGGAVVSIKSCPLVACFRPDCVPVLDRNAFMPIVQHLIPTT